MRKQMFILAWLMCNGLAIAQTIQVGDTVMVNRSVQNYLTGERPSLWVYDVPHIISQVGSKYYPEGVLLNIKGANSWLSKNDITLLSTNKPTEEDAKEEAILEHTTTTGADTMPVVVHEIIHDTVYKEIVEQTIISHVDTIEVVEIAKEKAVFQLNGNILGLGGKYNGGVGIELLFGARISDYVFIGGGLELEQIWLGLDGKSVHGMQFPIFANIKTYLPVQHKYYPHVEMSAGLNLGKLDNGQSDLGRKSGIYTGLHARAGIGFDYKALSIGIGYQYGSGCSSIKDDHHHGYLKIGFVFTSK